MPTTAQPLDGNYKPITALIGTPVTASNTGAAAAGVTVTLPGTTGATTYIAGFICTSGAPGSNRVEVVTVTGVISGTMSYQFVESSAYGGQLNVFFPEPIPASAPNTGISVVIPGDASGAAVAAVAYGFQL